MSFTQLQPSTNWDEHGVDALIEIGTLPLMAHCMHLTKCLTIWLAVVRCWQP